MGEEQGGATMGPLIEHKKPRRAAWKKEGDKL